MGFGISAEIQSGRRDKPDGQTRTSHGCVRATWLPPVSSHLASAGVGPERYAAVVNPPVGGKREIQKLLHVPSSKARQNLILSPEVAPDLWVMRKRSRQERTPRFSSAPRAAGTRRDNMNKRRG